MLPLLLTAGVVQPVMGTEKPFSYTEGQKKGTEGKKGEGVTDYTKAIEEMKNDAKALVSKAAKEGKIMGGFTANTKKLSSFRKAMTEKFSSPDFEQQTEKKISFMLAVMDHCLRYNTERKTKYKLAKNGLPESAHDLFVIAVMSAMGGNSTAKKAEEYFTNTYLTTRTEEGNIYKDLKNALNTPSKSAKPDETSKALERTVTELKKSIQNVK